MFKKMRNRMLMNSMVLFGLVIVISLSTTYFVVYYQTQVEIAKKLETVWQSETFGVASALQGERYLEHTGESEELPPSAFPLVTAGRVLNDYTPYLVYAMDENNEPIYISGIYFGTLERYHELAQRVWVLAEEQYARDAAARAQASESLSIEEIIEQHGGSSTAGTTYSTSEPASVSSISGEIADTDLNNRETTWRYMLNSQGAITEYNASAEVLSTLPGHTSIYFLDITSYKEQLNQLALTLVLIGLGALAALLVISAFLTGSAMRPVKESWQKQKQFVTDASHELRTPLAALSATVDAIQANGEETVSSQAKWFTNMHIDLQRMGKLTGDLLYLAESEDAQEECVPFNLSLMCERAIASREALLYNRHIEVQAVIEEGLSFNGNEERVEQVLLILLDNAAKYTDEGGIIIVALHKKRGRVELSVQNTGEGISEADLPKVFERFYRGDPARSGEQGGFGLGLAIARTIVERAGGRIEAQSAAGLTTFTVTLKA